MQENRCPGLPTGWALTDTERASHPLEVTKSKGRVEVGRRGVDGSGGSVNRTPLLSNDAVGIWKVIW